MKPCPEYEERISEMLFGEIPENEAHMLHIHMSGCDGCMNFYLSLYETLEADQGEDFSLTDEQKDEIFKVAEKLDKPIKKLSRLWTTGLSIAASLIVSGIIILSDKDLRIPLVSQKESEPYDREKSAEIIVNIEDAEELLLTVPEEQLFEFKKIPPSLESSTSPVLNEAPSTEDNISDRAFSDIVLPKTSEEIEPTAGSRISIVEGKPQVGKKEEEGMDLVVSEAENKKGFIGGIADAGEQLQEPKKKIRVEHADVTKNFPAEEVDPFAGEVPVTRVKNNGRRETQKPVDENFTTVDLVGTKGKQPESIVKDENIAGDLPNLERGEYNYSDDSSKKTKDWSLSLEGEKSDRYVWRGLVDTKENKEEERSLTLGYSNKGPDESGKKPIHEEFEFEEDDEKFKNRFGLGHISKKKSENQKAVTDYVISQEEKTIQQQEELEGHKSYIYQKQKLEEALTKDPYNEEVVEELAKVNKKIFESGRLRRTKLYQEYIDEVEWKWSDPIDKQNELLRQKRLESLNEFSKEDEGNRKAEVQKGKESNLKKIEEALKQQKELEADNKFINAQFLSKDGDIDGAKKELEKAISKLEELPEEPRVNAKKEKYLELYSSLVQPKQSKRRMLSTQAQPMSTFSIDVDTASYQMAKKLINSGSRPDPLSVRAEEFINYFNYKYEAPKTRAFKVHNEVVNSPFHRGSKIMKIGVQGKRPGGDHRAASHFCFIVDTSGSMAGENRLPMVKRVLPMIIKQMSPGDRVSLVSCGLSSRLVLDYTDIQDAEYISNKIKALNAVGATNLEASLVDGYKHILKHVKKGTYNRVVLFSDGVANLGEQNADNILKTLGFAREKGVGITVIGMGEEEYNDNFLETLADKGDGNYVYIGDSKEAQKTFEEKFAATFHTIAYNVKIQVEFDPGQVAKYRLLGYENRRLKNKDFRNDKVDAGEVGSGQSVTAIYELEMTGKPSSQPLAEVRLRYRDAVDNEMKEFATAVLQSSYNIDFENASEATRLALISGKFAEVLRDGGSSEGITVDDLMKYLRPLAAHMNDQDVQELLNLINKSR